MTFGNTGGWHCDCGHFQDVREGEPGFWDEKMLCERCHESAKRAFYAERRLQQAKERK